VATLLFLRNGSSRTIDKRERKVLGGGVEIPSLTKLSEVDATYQTPKKLKVGTLLEVLADTIPIGIGKAEKIAVIQDHMLAADGSARESTRNSSIRTVLAE
jgi:hypothetical protein